MATDFRGQRASEAPAPVEGGAEVVAAYTQPDRPAGRGRKLSESPVKQAAFAAGVPVEQPETLRDAGARARLAAHMKEGNRARVVAAIMGVIISFTYVTAQVTGIGIIMSRFLGVNYLAGVAIGLGAVLFCSYLGGMRAISFSEPSSTLPISFLSTQSSPL